MNEDDKITLIITVGLFIAGAVLIIQLLTACTNITVNSANGDSKISREAEIDSGFIDIED